MDVDRRVVKLLGGSTWLLDTESLLLPSKMSSLYFPNLIRPRGRKI